MATTFARTSSPVCSPGTTSIMGIRCGGLDQCMPITRCGCLSPFAISEMGIPDVFVARMAVAAQCSSRFAKTSRLSSIFSGTASRTRSAPETAAGKSTSNETDPPGCDGAPTRSSTCAASSVAAFARSRTSALMSFSLTCEPERASTAAIPGPIVPAPTIAEARGIVILLPPSSLVSVPVSVATLARVSAAGCSSARRRRRAR